MVIVVLLEIGVHDSGDRGDGTDSSDSGDRSDNVYRYIIPYIHTHARTHTHTC